MRAPVKAPPAAPSPAPPDEESPAAEEAPPPSGPVGEHYNVFLSKISSGDKKEQAAKLISEIKRCSIEEARDLAGRLIIPLLKEVPRSEAEVALNKFKAIRVTGRMTLSKPK